MFSAFCKQVCGVSVFMFSDLSQTKQNFGSFCDRCNVNLSCAALGNCFFSQ